MNDFLILAVPFAGASLFYGVWLIQLRQQEAARRARKRERIAYAVQQTAQVRAQIKAQEVEQVA